MDVVAVGDLMLDVRVASGALAPGGDVHGRVVVQPGGTSANAAVWAAWTGVAAAVMGRVGDDLAGRLVVDAIADRGVEVTAVGREPEIPTGTMLVVHEGDHRSMVADRGAGASYRPEHLPTAIVAGAVLISGYLLQQEPGHETALAALEAASAPVVGVDAGSWPLVRRFGADRFFDETGSVDALFANEDEAEALVGRRGEEAARELAERYRYVCVKRGRDGVAMVADGDAHVAPGEPIEQVDPTGAGDAFDGVFLATLAKGGSPEEALARGTHAGALVAGSSATWPEQGAR